MAPAVAPRADAWVDEPYRPSLTVYEPETPARDTGLLDKDGRKIMSAAERQQIGYLPRR